MRDITGQGGHLKGHEGQGYGQQFTITTFKNHKVNSHPQYSLYLCWLRFRCIQIYPAPAKNYRKQKWKASLWGTHVFTGTLSFSFKPGVKEQANELRLRLEKRRQSSQEMAGQEGPITGWELAEPMVRNVNFSSSTHLWDPQAILFEPPVLTSEIVFLA